MIKLNVNSVRKITLNALKPRDFDKLFKKIKKCILRSARRGQTSVNVNLDGYDSDFTLLIKLKLKSSGFVVIEPISFVPFNLVIKWD